MRRESGRWALAAPERRAARQLERRALLHRCGHLERRSMRAGRAQMRGADEQIRACGRAYGDARARLDERLVERHPSQSDVALRQEVEWPVGRVHLAPRLLLLGGEEVLGRRVVRLGVARQRHLGRRQPLVHPRLFHRSLVPDEVLVVRPLLLLLPPPAMRRRQARRQRRRRPLSEWALCVLAACARHVCVRVRERRRACVRACTCL
eukprot:6212187-Pleurochrysis_carterae.AAC.1